MTTMTIDTLGAGPAGANRDAAAAPAAGSPAPTIQAATSSAAEPAARTERGDREWARNALRVVLSVAFGLAALIAVWAAVAHHVENFPGPKPTWTAAVKLFSHPFYDNGPNDKGIGWNVLESLKRVGVGFGLAAAIGIPLGFVLGRFKFVSTAADPVISLLRPVSPLAWLPIGLLVFREADKAAIWVIFICSIWPMIINTAAGVRAVPQDYLNVARVLALPETKVITKILFPAVLPYILTGVRLAVGTAWLVIVAAEMLTGGIGIGFWVWDEWNNLKVEHILIAIFVIGIVGLLLEQLLLWTAKRLSHGSL